LAGCKKNSEPEQPVELLTRGEWLLTAFGYDDDASGRIEPYENMANACHLDNITRYHADGTGVILENALLCTADTVHHFQWQFNDLQNALIVNHERLDIYRLTANELHLTYKSPYLTTAFHTVYTKVE